MPKRAPPPFTPPADLEARPSSLGGLGVFAARAFAEGELIERAPVLLAPVEQAAACPALAPYAFMWSDTHVALTLGFGSLYNHSYEPNAEYADEAAPRGAAGRDAPPGHAGGGAKRFTALRDIAAGEEITVNYNGDPDDDGEVGFAVRGDG